MQPSDHEKGNSDKASVQLFGFISDGLGIVRQVNVEPMICPECGARFKPRKKNRIEGLQSLTEPTSEAYNAYNNAAYNNAWRWAS